MGTLRSEEKGSSIPMSSYHRDYERKWVLQSGIKQVIISSQPFENLLGLYCTSALIPHGLFRRLTLIFKADLPLPLIDGWVHHWCLHIHQAKLPVMNESVLYQPCITSWRIVCFHPVYLSFSQRLINHGGDSVSNYDLFANQSTSSQGTALLTVWHMHSHTLTHTHTHTQESVSTIRHWSALLSWIMGKSLASVE